MSWLRSALLGPSDSLHFRTESVRFFTCYDESLLPELPPPASLSGSVVLKLVKQRQISHIEVGLEGKSTVKAPDGTIANSTTLDSRISIPVGQELQPGEHAFRFTLEWPRTTAQSVVAPEGEVRHRLWAKTNGGTAGEEPITLVGVTQPDCDPPPNWDIHVEGDYPELGPYSFTSCSENLTIGGLIATSTRLEGMRDEYAGNWVSTSIASFVRQIAHGQADSSELFTTKRDVYLARHEFDPVDRSPIYERSFVNFSTGMERTDGEPATSKHYELKPDGRSSYRIQLDVPGAPKGTQFARLPSHKVLQASTPPGMSTPVRIEHRLGLQIGWIVEGRPKVFILTKCVSLTSRSHAHRSFALASCRCTAANVNLPPYENLEEARPKANAAPPCACEQSILELIDDRTGWPKPDIHVVSDESPDVDPRAKAFFDSAVSSEASMSSRNSISARSMSASGRSQREPDLSRATTR